MTGRNKIVTALVVIALPLFAASTVMAATEHGSGTVTFANSAPEITNLPGGGKVMRINSRGVLIADDPASPFNLSTQDCSGSLVVGANGKPMIESGFCQAIDRDGDTWSLWYENGAAGNIWKVIGGTGKYLKMTGGGTTTELFTSLNGRETVLHWDGSWQR
jgi:hypothetical protein